MCSAELTEWFIVGALRAFRVLLLSTFTRESALLRAVSTFAESEDDRARCSALLQKARWDWSNGANRISFDAAQAVVLALRSLSVFVAKRTNCMCPTIFAYRSYCELAQKWAV